MGPVEPISPGLLPRLTVNDLLWVANTRHGPAAHWHARARADGDDHDHLRDPDGGTSYLAAHHVPVPQSPPSRAALDRLVVIREAVRALVESNAPAVPPDMARIVAGARFRIDPGSGSAAGRLASAREGWAGLIDDLVPPFLELTRLQDRLGICGNPLCRLVFVDLSAARSRRWCDGGGCGNRARVARNRRSATRPSRRAPLIVGLTLLLAGCAAAPLPTATPAADQRWVATSIDLPAVVTGQASGAPIGQQCSPCHPSQVDYLLGVARVDQGYVAVGIQTPPAVAVAWRSSDGRQWSSLIGLSAAAGSQALAVAGSAGRVVIVGSDADGATSWASTDGGMTWSQAPAIAALAGAHGTAFMTAVVPWQGGFVGAGYRILLPSGDQVAAVWRSADGVAWRLASNGPGFKGGRISGLAATASTVVAVGTSKDQFRGPAAVWLSHDGESWSAVHSPTFGAGAMAAVSAGGPGFVAVGSGSADDRAAAWTSADGSTWTSARDGPAFEHYTLPVRMAGVTTSGSGLVAVGWMSSGANGQGAVWRSPDGLAWTREPDQTSLLGGELTGVTTGPQALIGVGLVGYPDNDQAQVWLGPP